MRIEYTWDYLYISDSLEMEYNKAEKSCLYKEKWEGIEEKRMKRMKSNSEPAVGENMNNFRQWFLENNETQEILSCGK